MLYKKVTQLIIYIKNTLINCLSDNKLDLYCINKKSNKDSIPVKNTMIDCLYNLFIITPLLKVFY